MINKKIGFLLTFLLSLICVSLMITNITNTYAKKKYQPLQGITIVLDAGHGGIDDGARRGNIKEDVINLNITVKLKALLENVGANVILTRNGDHDLAEENSENRKRADMKKRVEIINQEQVDLFLSIHLNSYPNTSVKGAMTFYQKDNEVSKVFAQIVQKHLKALTDTKMSTKIGDYYILNNAKKTGVLIECGFLSNSRDRGLLIDEDYQDKLAKSIYESVFEYLSFLM